MRSLRRALRYFEHVARANSIRAASVTLNIAPSAVSRAVQQLEDEVGVPLFDRTVRGLYLTAAGETVLAYVRRWERESGQLAIDLGSLSGTRYQALRVATIEAAAYELVPEAAAAVRTLVPGLQFDLKVGDTPTVLEAILNGSVEVGVVINTPKSAPVVSLWTFTNPVGVVVRKGHRLAERERVRLAECLADPLILPDEGLAARSAIQAALQAAGPFRSAASSNRIVAIKALVRAGIGVAFLTRLDVAAEVRAGEFSFVQLDDRQVDHPLVSVITARNAKGSPVSGLFVEALRKGAPAVGFAA